MPNQDLYELMEAIFEAEKLNKTQVCMHKSCPQCHGTGRREDGLGPCIHMISCPCPNCTPRC